MRSLLLVWLVAGCGEVAKLQLDAKVPVCGDSVIDPGEACDDGAETASCNDDCTGARCGDSKVNTAANEQCDDGDSDNLNACTNVCEARTSAFRSTGAEGPFAPTANVTLTGGVHNYTTINIPAGVTVTVDTGILELRATGAVKIDGVIDLSGGDGADGAVHPSQCYAGGGGGGATGNPTPGASGTACTVAALGGSGVAGGDGLVFNTGCPGPGGKFGGGNGGGQCNGAGGGGGYAGGGGGAGYSTGHGGAGATGFGGVGGAGGVANSNSDGSGKTPGRGGRGTGRYAGTDGTFTAGCTAITEPSTSGGGGAIGTYAESDRAVETTFRPGSGGGGGSGHCNQCSQGGGGGGGGGGAIRIASPVSITIGATGSVLANGGDGGDASVGIGGNINGGNAGGGGGSGGVIYLAAPNLDVQAGASISAIGGVGGVSNVVACGRGGDGGIGRIRISAKQDTCTLSGSFVPALAAVGCAAANVTEKTFVAPYPN